MSVDVITTLCFGNPIHAVDAPDFNAPIVVALDASTPVSLYFKYSDLFKNFILKCPPKLSRILSPLTAGLIDLNQVCLFAFLYVIIIPKPKQNEKDKIKE